MNEPVGILDNFNKRIKEKEARETAEIEEQKILQTEKDRQAYLVRTGRTEMKP